MDERKVFLVSQAMRQIAKAAELAADDIMREDFECSRHSAMIIEKLASGTVSLLDDFMKDKEWVWHEDYVDPKE